MKMKKGGLLLKFMSMILVIFLVTPMVLELGIVASFASTYYKKYQKDEGVYIYDDIQGSLSVTYRVYGEFYEESYGGLHANGKMDTTETVKVPITVSVSRSYNPNSKYEDMRYKYTYDIKAQSVDDNWSAEDYTVADGLDHDLGSWVLANGSVTASVPKISQWEGKYASTDYDKSIPISEKINTDGVSMSVSSFKDMNPDWFVKDDWYSLNVNVLKANVEFEIPAFTQLTVKWDEGVSTVYDYWSQHNHSDLGELVNGGKYLYQKGDRAYTFINLKEGYDFDYIGEGSNDLHWTDSKWNTTENRWENSWSMANDREIYIHTKKQIKTLNLSWDSGVNMVIGHSTEGSDMQMPNGSDVCYYYGTTAPAWIYLNSGYDIDYIEDLDSHEKIYVSSSDWSEDNSRYDKYFEMKQNRKLKIHTKPALYTLTIDPNGGTMYNGNAKTSSVFTTKFLYGRKTYIGNSYTDKYGYLDYENNTPTKEGYTFAGWKFSNGTGGLNSDGSEFFFGEIAADEDTTYDDDDIYIFNGNYNGDVTATAQWTADTNTKYVVNHWKQNIGSDAGKHDSSNYTLAETYNLTGITDTPVTPAVKTYTGFTSPDVQTVNINGDGSTVVNYYYTRNKYKIDDGGNNDGTGSDDGSGDTGNDKGNGIKDITGGGEYYYEEEVSMEAVVKRGYHWHIDDDCHTDRSKYPTGWTVTKPGYGIEKFLDNTNYGTQKIRFVMPAHDVYVRADATNNSYTIEFERNGGTGNMPAIEATYAVPVTLPDNSFTKTTAFGNSTFLYWEDAKNDTTYDDKSVVESLTDEFNGTVILKAAWDDCPEITAQERWFTVDDSQNGKITLEELLSTAKVTDDRDPDMEDKLTVKYYQANIFKQFKTDGYVMVTYTATDSSNNTTEVTVKINIVDTVAVEQEKNTYARFIAPQYYKESYENGGLEDDSIWKKNPDYAAVLESAMNNRESMHYEYIDTKLFGAPFRIRKQACEYSDHLLEKWVFTKDDIKAVKEYINEHGIGNLKEADALANFRIQFAHCRQQ